MIVTNWLETARVKLVPLPTVTIKSRVTQQSFQNSSSKVLSILFNGSLPLFDRKKLWIKFYNALREFKGSNSLLPIRRIFFKLKKLPKYIFSLHMHAKPSFAHHLQTAKMASSRTSVQNNGPWV